MIIVLTIFRMLIFLKIIVQYSYVVYNVKVIYTEEKTKKIIIIILFFTHASPANKFMAPPLLTPLNKNPGTAIALVLSLLKHKSVWVFLNQKNKDPKQRKLL